MRDDGEFKVGPLSRLRLLAMMAEDSSVPPSALRVANALALATNSSTGDCWPSVATLGRLSALSRRSVQVGLTALIDGHWLTTGKRRGGRSKSNHYRLAV